MIATPTSLPQLHRATCPYCGVGCVMSVAVEGNLITKIQAREEDLPNHGMLCHKGTTLSTPAVHASGRLTHPMIRLAKDAPLEKVAWPEAINFIASRLHAILRKSGPGAIAAYGSGQLDTEASYILSKFMKGGIGSNHMDTNSRLCMASAASGYTLSLGSDGPPTCYDDLRQADTFFLVGANMQVNHPVLFNFIRQRRANHPGAKIIVADPRQTKTAQAADLHLPVKPGGDVAMLQWIARKLLLLGKIDESFIASHTEGFESRRELLLSLDESQLQAACGLAPSLIDNTVAILAGSPKLLTLYCMGANQSSQGVEKNLAIINLHLQLGAIGKFGAGPFSLTGQPNAMGGRECGYMAHQLPGYRLIENPQHRKEVETLWNLPEGFIAPKPGLHAVAMFEAAARGDLEAMWIVCTNPAVSMPDGNTTQAGLKRVPLLIVQDCYHPTETSAYADVLLPAAQWGEKTGTMTNSERLVMRTRKFLQPPGAAREDWRIVCDVAQAMGLSGFDFKSSDAIWDEYRTLTRHRPCDQFGMTNRRLDAGPLHWPCPSENHPGTLRRYTDHQFPTATGKAKFVPVLAREAVDAVSEEYPLVLTTGRVFGQWHTRTRTGKIPHLNKLDPEPYIEVHPDDAARLNLAHGQKASLLGRRGKAVAKLVVTPRIRPGVVFMPFHWGDLFDPESSVNDLTSAAFDPTSKQPELKYAAVRLEAVMVAQASRLCEGSDAHRRDACATTHTQAGEPVMSASPTPPSPEMQEYQNGYQAGLQIAASLRNLLGAGGALALPQIVAGAVQPGGPIPPAGPELIHWEAQQRFLAEGKKLTKEEEAKRAKNPLDMWDQITANADAGVYPSGTDGFLYRYQGLFYVAPAQDSYMCRLRIPGGHLTSSQLRGIADLATRLAGGYADATTRANLQLREIKAPHAADVLTGLQELGIVARGSGADNIRNMTASPLSGFDPQELIETLPLARAMHHHILNHREMFGLPRKFNIAFDGGGSISALEDTNDIGFSAIRVPPENATSEVPAGVYFRLALGGITGHQDFARDTGILLKSDECVPAAAAMVKVFIAHGDRTDRKKARLKYLLDAWGFEKFIAETEKLLGKPLRRFPLAQCASRHEPMRQSHIGFHKQVQPGMNYVGVLLPVGRMTTAQMQGLAFIADRYGSGILRLTVWQNLLIPNIAQGCIDAVKEEIEKLGLEWQASAIRSGLVACTGSKGCRFASADTKGDAMRLATHLEARLTLDQPINIHLTGCHNSCAQHYIGDIGLLATKVPVSDDQMVDGYHIHVGGGYADQAGIGRQIETNVTSQALPERLESMLAIYLAQRRDSETFAQFTRRHTVEELQTLFAATRVEVTS